MLPVALLLGLLSSLNAGDIAEVTLSPLPEPLGVPAPGPKTDAPYAPQTLLPGGVVIPLFPPDSPYLKPEKLREPEVYKLWGSGQVGSIVHIHNPSLEFHAGNGQLNTGTAIILAGGGGHNTLNVGEASPFVAFFANHGISTVILRNRLRSDGYDPKTDGVNDALQAIKLVRAHAKYLKVDPHKIGIMGFSAGAELAANASLVFEDFDRRNDSAKNPLAKVSSRPDFVGSIYPGPSFFSRGGTPAIPRDAPAAFITCAGWGDWIHAVWANEYFTALLNDSVPNVEMHIYARGHHPGDKVGADEPPATGAMSNMGGISYGTWSARFLDWLRDLGFLNQPGVETQAARDVAANLKRVTRSAAPTAASRPANPTAPPASKPQ